jgi:hypothetical protein
MQSQHKRLRESEIRKIFIVSTTILLFLVSCTQATQNSHTPSETKGLDLVPSATKLISTNTKSPVSSPTKLPTETQIPIHPLSDKALSPEGPWLLIMEDYLAYAINPDGSGLTKVIKQDYIFGIDQSSTNGYLAYNIDIDYSDETKGYQLHSVQLPYGPDTLLTELQNPKLLPSEDQSGPGYYVQSDYAIQKTPPKWSPDGRYIAFIGQIFGPTADVYVYDLKNNTRRQLTDGVSQAFNISWSPDNRFIFHSGAEEFGTGAGYSGNESWLVSRDGEELITTTTGNGLDTIISWLDSTHFILSSWSQPCGDGFVRMYNINDRNYTRIWPYYFEFLTVLPETKRFALSIPSDYDWCMEDQPTGLFVIDKIGAQPQKITDGEYTILADPSRPDAFILQDSNGIYRLTSDNKIQNLMKLPNASFAYSNTTNIWVLFSSFKGSGLWVGNLEEPPARIFNGRVQNAIWSPDGTTLYFLGGYDRNILYKADAPGYNPIPISPPLDLSSSFASLAWAYK